MNVYDLSMDKKIQWNWLLKEYPSASLFANPSITPEDNSKPPNYNTW